MNGNGSGDIPSLLTYDKSVQKGDFVTPSVGGGVFNFWVYPDILAAEGLPVLLPSGMAARQKTLQATIKAESMWGSAVAIAIAKGAARGWEVEGNIAIQRKRVHDTLTYATAGVQVGYTHFIRHHLTGYFCAPFVIVELIRETNNYLSRVIGINHLPPSRCELTGDPEIPVTYRDKQGRVHELRWWQVGIFSDMPDVDEDLGGAGVCAAERAYDPIRKLQAMERYVIDKVTGRRPLALYFTSGIGQQQLKDGISTAKNERVRQDMEDGKIAAKAMGFMGAVIIPTLTPDAPAIATIPLAELPDGFNRKEEFDIAILSYANALGIDVQDLQPLTGQALGTGAQSQVLAEKEDGKGLSLWYRTFAEWLNSYVTPKSTTFSWYDRDLRDERAKADIAKVRADTGDVLIKAGVVTAPQWTNVLVDFGDLPDEFLVADATQTEDVADDEKPETQEDAQEEAEEQVEDNTLLPASKAAHSDLDALFEQELSMAKRVARKAQQ